MDETVEYIDNLLKEVIESGDLPESIIQNHSATGNDRYNLNEIVRPTVTAAKALRAKLWVYAASPLFNGNSKFYSNFVDKDGVQLMPLTYDANKWVLARDACKEAIELAVLNGHDLYKKERLPAG